MRQYGQKANCRLRNAGEAQFQGRLSGAEVFHVQGRAAYRPSGDVGEVNSRHDWLSLLSKTENQAGGGTAAVEGVALGSDVRVRGSDDSVARDASVRQTSFCREPSGSFSEGSWCRRGWGGPIFYNCGGE